MATGVSENRTQRDPGEIDGRGLSISTAILYEVVTALEALDPGGELRIRVDATPALDSDIHAWARTTGHELITEDEAASQRRYLVRRTDRPRGRPPWALVISDPGLEELLSPLGFALAAALGGSQVALYFQGPGVHVLERGFRERLKGVHRAPFSRFARRGLARSGHPAPQEKLRQLRSLGSRIYACGPSMEHFRVDPEDLLFDDIRIAAYPSFAEEMDAADVQIFLQ